MKILFENKAVGSTITSDNENANYPAQNLDHVFQRVKYKSNTFEDEIVLMLDEDASVNSFWYGFSNATDMTVKLYSSSSVLLDTITVDCTETSGAEFFTAQTIRWIEIVVSCEVTEDLYIGGVAIGLSKDVPAPLATFEKSTESSSSKGRSAEGQVSFQYTEPLLKFNLNFDAVGRSEYWEFFQDMYEVDGGHIWIDITPDSHDVYPPIYCTTETIQSPARDDSVSYRVTFTEAR
jgi:hypothetical protein